MGKTSMWLLKKIAGSLLRIIVGVPIISLLLAGLLLLVFSATLAGRSIGLSATVFAVVLYCSVDCWNRNWLKRIRPSFYGVLLPLGLLLYLVPMMLAPSGGKPDARARNCFLNRQGTFARYSPGNVLPEVDQLKVGMCLLPLGEVDWAEAARIRSLVLPLYAAMDKDADFGQLGSVMGSAYAELFHAPFHSGHYYVVLPKVSAGRQIPSLVFLHGLGGNMKACLWVLSKLSQQTGCAIIAPTFGFGNWDRPESADFITAVVRESLATLPLDPKRVFLMGYSNGAMGVTRAAIQSPKLFAGLIYLSPVTEDEMFSRPEFLSRHDREILFLHGGRDQRIPKAVVTATANSLERLKCDVTLKVYDDEDHYLLFSQQQAVLNDLGSFMAGSSLAARSQY